MLRPRVASPKMLIRRGRFKRCNPKRLVSNPSQNGLGIYQKALGPSLDNLPSPQQRFYSDPNQWDGHGKFTILLNQRVGWLLQKILHLPSQGTDLPTDVIVSTKKTPKDEPMLFWERTFLPTKTQFLSLQWFAEDSTHGPLMIEAMPRLSWIHFCFSLFPIYSEPQQKLIKSTAPIKDTPPLGIYHQLIAVKISLMNTSFKLPAFLSPTIHAYTFPSEEYPEGWKVVVKIYAPEWLKLGILFGYVGTLMNITPRKPKT